MLHEKQKARAEKVNKLSSQYKFSLFPKKCTRCVYIFPINNMGSKVLKATLDNFNSIPLSPVTRNVSLINVTTQIIMKFINNYGAHAH
jgi:predicted Rdx family selenoprotein